MVNYFKDQKRIERTKQVEIIPKLLQNIIKPKTLENIYQDEI